MSALSIESCQVSTNLVAKLPLLAKPKKALYIGGKFFQLSPTKIGVRAGHKFLLRGLFKGT